MPDVRLIDNHDSFTLNIAHAFQELGADTEVVDVDAMTSAFARAHPVPLVVVGPGPRGPRALPHLCEIIRALDDAPALFGICLGLQAMVLSTGGDVGRAEKPIHGKARDVVHDGHGVLLSLPNPFRAMRYNSLVATRVTAPYRVTATDAAGQCMAISDDDGRRQGVQFHPESILTEGGLVLLANAMTRAGLRPLVRHRVGAIPPPRDHAVFAEG